MILLLAKLEAEQAAGWAAVTPPRPPDKVLVIVPTAPLTAVDRRHARDTRTRNYRRSLK